MSLEWIAARVGVGAVDKVDSRAGRQASCEGCDGTAFALFRVGGHSDLFAQCCNCSRVCRVDEQHARPSYVFEPATVPDVDSVPPCAPREDYTP